MKEWKGALALARKRDHRTELYLFYMLQTEQQEKTEKNLITNEYFTSI